MAGFTRRYTSDPGLEEIMAIEGTIIIDREPAATLSAQGSGVVHLVGEFEDGEFNQVLEVMSGDDFAANYGGFGFVYDGVASCNPCARKRSADSALVPEYWNGNGFIAAVNKKFRRLLVTRVDTTVGEVQFTRLASVLGNTNFNWDLTSGQFLEFDLNRNAAAATKAVLDKTGGVSPQTFLGTETIAITLDAGTPYAQSISVTVSAGSKTAAQVIALLNAAFGTVQASIPTAGTCRITSRVAGTAGKVNITAVDALITTLTGFIVTSPVVTGTGTSPTWATFTGVEAVLTSAAGSYPLSLTGGESVTITIDAGQPTARSATVALLATDTTQNAVIARINAALGYTAAANAGGSVTTITGLTKGTGGSVTISGLHSTIAAGVGLSETTVAGTGNVTNIDQVPFASAKSVIEAAGGTSLAVDRGYGGELRVANTAVVGATRTLQVTGGTAAAAFGFDTTVEGNAFVGVATKIPAGTRVRNAGGAEWVVAKSVATVLTDDGPFTARVRPASDDGTATTAGVGTVTVIPFAFTVDAWAVINLTSLSAALTESQIDAAYVTAIDSTKSSTNVSRETNLLVSARQSNAVRQRIRMNAPDASSSGLRGRMGIISPPLGTTRATARSTSAQPGVGAYRSDRVIYAYPGALTYVPQIATRGTAGGVGFTADGYIDTHFDAWVASLCSRVNPEENPGQMTEYLLGIAGVERGNADVQSLTEPDYRAFKAAGIAALRIDEGVAIVQSGKTSVDPATYPALQNIARRRMADYLQDNLAARTKKFTKKMSSKANRATCLGELTQWLAALKPNRIEDYRIDAVSGNTPDTLAAGIYRLKIKVRTIASMDFIVLDTEIGEAVTITEAAA